LPEFLLSFWVRIEAGEPGIHNDSLGLWIPGSRLRRAPE
jgi:hypothetical protein